MGIMKPSLEEFLKCEKVRCVKAYDDCLTVDKEYSVLDIRMEVKVKDDEGDNCYWESEHFEPVLDSAETPLQNIELTPEFETEASEPKFQVGNKVYKYGETDVKTVLEVFEDGYMRISNYPHRVNHEVICHATPENHALLSKPFPAIEFEQPPKELKGNDLARAMLINGHKFVVVRDKHTKKIHVVKDFGIETKKLVDASTAELLEDVEPIDPRTGLPLTQAVLDE